MSIEVSLFENLPEYKLERNKNPMIGPYDKALPDNKCKECIFLKRIRGGVKIYSKCELRGITHGKGTDHSMYWDACFSFKKEKE